MSAVIPTRLRGRVAVALGMVLACGILLASPAHAAESIRAYDVTATVSADGTLTVTETIAYDFGDAERRGIFRTIPVEDELPDGSRWIHPITVETVTMDGAPVRYETTAQGPLLEVRIGDPDITITGEHVYAITYAVQGALRTMTAEDLSASNPYGFRAGDVELYWDFVGTAWEVPIDSATVEVRGPGGVLAAQCFTGGYGATSGCTDRIVGEAAQFRQQDLFPGEGLSVVIAYPGSAFTTAPVRVIEQAPLSSDPGRILPFSAGLAALALLVPPITAALLRRRIRGVDIPYAPVRYGPPGGLRPAEISVSLDGELEPRGVLATLLDLVARRYITLSSDPGGFMKQAKIELAWWGAGTDILRPWEERMLAAIFEGRDRATLQGYDSDFAKAVESARDDLKAQATAAERYNPRMASARGGVGCAASVSLILVIVGFFASIMTENAVIYAGVLPILIALTIGLFVASFIVPDRETVTSARFEADVEGFKRLLDTDPGAARRDLVHRLGLPDYAVYATFLPYAVLFDLESAWSGAFPDLTEDQLHSTGLFLASTAAIHGVMSVGATTVGAAYTAPKASGGSGFSSGGGFSGGGGGGGGGGSW